MKREQEISIVCQDIFDIVEHTQYEQIYPPERVFNINEPDTITVQRCSSKAIVLRGRKRDGMYTSAERETLITGGNMYLMPDQQAFPGHELKKMRWECPHRYVI